MIFDNTLCQLGEGPLWHPERGELFWFDILGRRLHWLGGARTFDDYVSRRRLGRP
jgi:sugar lactone lactonase YvrE